METIVIVIHMLAALAIVGLILLQQGKGAEMGASFGAGGSQTLFGSRGSANFLSRSTAVIATIFFVTSFGLAVLAKQKATVDDNMGFSVPVDEVPVSTQEQPVNDVPVSDESGENAVSEVPTVEPAGDAANDEATEVPAAEEVPVESN